MAIRKYKNNSKKHSRKSKRISKSQQHKKKQNQNKNKTRKQRGGFAGDCNLASVKEPGFNIPSLGDIAGLSIPESRGAIFRPNCKADTYQAMTP